MGTTLYLSLSPEYLAEDNSQPLLTVCILFIVLETLFIVLLYLSRYLSHESKVGLNMLSLMTVGYVICMGKITIGILLVKIGGAGHHIQALPRSTLKHTLKLQTALQIICPATTSISKLGICCLFLQIFGHLSKTYRIVIKSTFCLVLAVLLVQVLIPFGNCKPFSYTWDKTIYGHCTIDALALWRYLSIPNVVTTFIMIAIPLPALYNLRVSVPTKVGLSIVFVWCAFGLGAAVMRLQAFLEVKDFSDITFECIKPLSWTITESGTYLIAGVLPTLRPLVGRLFKGVDFEKLISRTRSRGRTSGGTNGEKEPQTPNVVRKMPFEVSTVDVDGDEEEVRKDSGGGKSSLGLVRSDVME